MLFSVFFVVFNDDAHKCPVIPGCEAHLSNEILPSDCWLVIDTQLVGDTSMAMSVCVCLSLCLSTCVSVPVHLVMHCCNYVAFNVPLDT